MHGTLGRAIGLRAFGFFLEMLIRARLARLTLERIELPPNLRNDVLDPKQILLRRVQLPQGFGLLLLITDDPGRFLDELTAILRGRI